MLWPERAAGGAIKDAPFATELPADDAGARAAIERVRDAALADVRASDGA